VGRVRERMAMSIVRQRLVCEGGANVRYLQANVTERQGVPQQP